MPSDQSFDPSLSDLASLFRRGLPIALLIAALVGAATFFISRSQEPRYQAQSTLLVAYNSEFRAFGVTLAPAPALDIGAYRTALMSEPVLSEALEALGTPAANPNHIEAFRRSISLRSETDRTSAQLHISAAAPSAETATQRANAVTQALLDWDSRRLGQNLQTMVAALEQQIAALDAEIAALRNQGLMMQDAQDQLGGLLAVRAQQQVQLGSARMLGASAVGLLEVLQPAAAPLEPVAPRPLRNAALAAVLGLLLAYGVLLLRQSFDTRVRNVDELARLLELPVLAEFAKQASRHRVFAEEASRYLRTNLLVATQAQPRSFLVTSAQAGEGKSSVALNLAQSFSADGYRTLLVDADLRDPAIAKRLALDPARHLPLASYLENPQNAAAGFSPARLPTGGAGALDVVPSFAPPALPTERLSSGFAACLQSWQERYDVIIIDSPPILPVADALTIAPLCSGTVLVADLTRSDRRRLHAAAAMVSRVGGQLLGVVATNVDPTEGNALYGYGHPQGEGARADSLHINRAERARA